MFYICHKKEGKKSGKSINQSHHLVSSFKVNQVEKMCSICVDPPEKDNPILNCERCDIKVHGLCYGILNIESFKCSPCENNLKPADLRCELCQRVSGALKQTTDGKWAHVICALFINGCVFVDDQNMEPIEILGASKSLNGKLCKYCGEKNGFTIRCIEKKCSNFLHVSCGLLINSLKEKANDKKSNQIQFFGVCLDHKAKYDKSKGFSTDEINRLKNTKFEKQHKADAQKNNADWVLKKIAVESTSNDGELKYLNNEEILSISFSNFLLKLAISDKAEKLISDVEQVDTSDQATVIKIQSNADPRKF